MRFFVISKIIGDVGEQSIINFFTMDDLAENVTPLEYDFTKSKWKNMNLGYCDFSTVQM